MTDSSKPKSFLSRGQSGFLASTLCTLGFFTLLLLCGWLLRELGRFLDFFSSVIWPLAIAAVLAILLRPIVRFTERRLNWGTNSAIVALYLLVLSVCALGLWGVGGEVIRQGRELAGSSMDWPEKIETRIRDRKSTRLTPVTRSSRMPSSA